MKLRYAFSFLLAFSFLTPLLFPLQVPAQPRGYVSDYAEIMLPSKRSALEATLRQFEEETTNQVVVATFPSLEEESLEDFSIRLSETWKIGQKGKDNGVILLIFKNDRKVRIEVGYGLEGVLPDATCKLIIQNEIVPRFRAGQFDEGVSNAVGAIIAATKGEYHAHRTPLLHVDWQLVGSLVWLFLCLIFGFYVLKNWTPGNYVITSGKRRSSYWDGSGPSGGSWGSGGGGGGGFSGGGGGFGGGGASGSW